MAETLSQPHFPRSLTVFCNNLLFPTSRLSYCVINAPQCTLAVPPNSTRGPRNVADCVHYLRRLFLRLSAYAAGSLGETCINANPYSFVPEIRRYAPLNQATKDQHTAQVFVQYNISVPQIVFSDVAIYGAFYPRKHIFIQVIRNIASLVPF